MIKDFRLYWSDLTAEKQQELIAEEAELILEDWREKGIVPKDRARKRELALILAEETCKREIRSVLVEF